MGNLLVVSGKVDEDLAPGILRLDVETAEVPEDGERQRIDEEQGEAGPPPGRDQRGQENEREEGDEQGPEDDPDEDDGEPQAEAAAFGRADFEAHEDGKHGFSLSSA